MIVHPYGDLNGGQWLRGNLHTHTTRSDGDRPPQDVVDDYARRGYDFLMISDHDCHLPAGELRELNGGEMVLIPGNEISANGPHLLHVNADRTITPHLQRQCVLNEVATGGGFVIACHPNWLADFNHCTIQQLSEWTGYAGLEIYNGTCGRLEGSPYATNKWDMLLGQGRRVWGFANDDTHHANEVANGWNVAYVKDRSIEGIVEALANGRFYASTGVTITDIRVEGTRIRIQTKDAERIVALMQVAQRFAVVDSNVIEVEVPPEATYVRFECWGRGERFAWTQPFFNLTRPDAPIDFPNLAAFDFAPVDLSRFCNLGLADDPDGVRGWTGEGERRDLRALPVGHQTFAGVPFDIVDPAQNKGSGLIAIRGCRWGQFPTRIPPIPIGRKLDKLYVLHGCAYVGLKAGQEMAKLTIRYKDQGTRSDSVAISIQNQVNILDYWFVRSVLEGTTRLPQARVAWVDSGPSRNHGIVAMEWNNPFPDAVIESIELEATAERAQYFLLGLTGAMRKPDA